jgi:DNA-binding NtrC family response regulator
VPRLAPAALARLECHAWPGNVRELHNALERVLVLLEGDVIDAADLPSDIGTAPRAATAAALAPEDDYSLAGAEARAVAAALEATQGRKGEAARLLGISWPTLNRKIRAYGLRSRDPADD